MFARVALLVLKKDFAIEVKSREILFTTLFFAVSCVLVFLPSRSCTEGRAVEDAAAGILWIAIAFAGTLALGRTFERERYGETLRALLAPGAAAGHLRRQAARDRRAARPGGDDPRAARRAAVSGGALRAAAAAGGLLVAGTIGFASVGTLFAAMLVRSRTRDVMLPILLYPITVPVIIAGVRGTAALLQPPPDEPVATMWIALLVCFDVVFVTLALWTFEPLMTEKGMGP